MRHYFWLFLLGILWCIPHTAQAASVPYLVQGEEVWDAAHIPDVRDGLLVPAGASLALKAGVVLRFAANAGVIVEGRLLVNGTVDAPVVFSASEPDQFWKGIFITPASSSLEGLRIEGALLPLQLQRGAEVLKNVHLLDNQENIVGIGDLFIIHTRQHIVDNFIFENKKLGKKMGSVGVLVRGTGADFTLRNARYLDTRTSAAEGKFIGGKVEGPYKDLHLLGNTHIRACSMYFVKTDRLRYGEYAFKESTCPTERVPVVFVPGFGTSIHLPKLVQANNRKPELEGWRFFQGLTPAYESFLQDMQRNNIEHEVAYYDWRLPVADLVTQYLIPHIEAVKKRSGSQVVHIVGHSYGGLIARAYIQGDVYQGDVLSLVQLGTPNKGAAKAYPVWEAGELPSDWQALNSLIRYYQYQQSNWTLSAQDIIHTYFPSVKDLLPIYPALFRDGQAVPIEGLFYQNETAQHLEKTISKLLDRAHVTTYSSISELTLEQLAVGVPWPQKLWPDGRLLDKQPPLTKSGDGTVPRQSVTIAEAQNKAVTGSHAELPEKASASLLKMLYPKLSFVSAPPLAIANRSSKNALWFFFDCPVVVTVTLPDGSRRSSTELEGVGDVAVAPEMIWMLIPYQEGSYTVQVTALADTPVRSWIEMGPMQEFNLRKGESKEWVEMSGIPLQAFASPTPAESPASLPSSTLTSPTIPSPMPYQGTDNLLGGSVADISLHSLIWSVIRPAPVLSKPTPVSKISPPLIRTPKPAHQESSDSVNIAKLTTTLLLGSGAGVSLLWLLRHWRK